MRIWTRAAEVAARTPEARNRYVDFLRAVSIFLVISGHWIAAAPYLDEAGKVVPTHVLAEAPWTHWLTWVIQVMPIFFMVGGFSNGISWSAALRDRTGYAAWLEGRLVRLVGPVLPLVVGWTALGAAAHAAGVSPETVAVGSQMALIPIWFLAVYVVVVLLTPLSHALWERLGLASFWALAAAAVAVDAVSLGVDAGRALGWTNYLFVWSAVHQLGYAWRDGHLTGRRTWLWAAGGLAALLALVTLGPYRVSMVGVPGEGMSNTTPPKIPLLALAMLQAGALLALQEPARRWLRRAVPWTATVLVNGMIMTIFLWHMTAAVLVIALSVVLGGVGLDVEPVTGRWWTLRPIWLAVLTAALVPLAVAAARFENPKRPEGGAPPPAWRLVLGTLLVCSGLAALALHGIASEGPLGLRLWAAALPLVGAGLIRRW